MVPAAFFVTLLLLLAVLLSCSTGTALPFLFYRYYFAVPVLMML
jgi:hypothetical protein